ncbi:LysR family transcriptional regulator [Microvirga sp. 2TAF3]|uniref:LysR family transcriptional regulator n=1 Tax=Microvirga sp. 2TAF3 TaxID=3233014 RepID=UPI003F95CF73
MEPFDPEQRNLIRTPLDNETILSGQFWGELRVFLAVAKAKSFNRAAEVLNTSQPTVSRRVKRLQDLMGSQLFVPTRHGVKLTAKGQSLAQALTRLDHSLYALTNDLKAETKDAEGVVRVSITDGLNTFFVAPAIPSFTAEHPKIQLHLKSPANVVSLRENQTDLMIGFSPTDAADITTRKLGSLHFIPVVAKSYIRQHGIPTRSNLAQHFFLQSEFYTARTGLWDAWNHAVAQGRIAHFCDNSMAYGMLVKAGLGVGLLGSYTILEPDAVPLELDVRIAVPLYALALTERLNARPVKLVFDWLSEMFGPANPWFSPELRLDPPPSRFDIGIKLLFNL